MEKESSNQTEEQLEKEEQCQCNGSELEKLAEEFEAHKAFALRLQADFENYKKRNKTLAADMYAEGKYDAITAILPVADNFDRALEMCASDEEKQGILLIKKQLDSVLEKLGVEAFGKSGEQFDPNLHNAVMQLEDADNKGKITNILQKGYKLGDKILRYAMVQVAI